MAFHSVPSFVRQLGPNLLWEMVGPDVESEKRIYLTFDDGPIPGPTEFVLEQLAKFSAKATFFAVGDNVHKHPEIIRKVQEAGHAIGNHTHNHLKGWSTPNSAYYANIELAETVLANQLPSLFQSARLFRPPYGQIGPRQSQDLISKGYKVVMWSILTADYDSKLSAAQCLQATYPHCKPGSIVVMHDSLKAFARLEKLLPALLKVLSADGFSFHPLA